MQKEGKTTDFPFVESCSLVIQGGASIGMGFIGVMELPSVILSSTFFNAL